MDESLPKGDLVNNAQIFLFADDDEDNYENLTYERVNIYFPTIEHKRPVILVGPRHIGISRLRERLLLENSDLASPIPRMLT